MRLTMASIRPREQRGGRGARRGMLLRIGDEALKGQRIGVAIGDQPAAGEDEGDLRVFRQIGVELGDDGDRHVERAVVLVQTVRRFDLLHFLARRHVDAERRLDQLLLGRRGLDEIDPQSASSGIDVARGSTRASPCGCETKQFSMSSSPAPRLGRYCFFCSRAARSLISAMSWFWPPADGDIGGVLAVDRPSSARRSPGSGLVSLLGALQARLHARRSCRPCGSPLR